MDQFKVVFVASLLCCLIAGSFSDLVKNSTNTILKPPPYLHLCYKDDQDFPACFKKTISSIIKETAHGIPELGIPPGEPLVLEEVETLNIAGLSFKIKDILCKGASNMTVTAVRGSLDTLDNLQVDTLLNEANLTANFEMSSSMFPFIWEGRVTSTVKDIQFFAVIPTEIITRNNVKYLNITSIDIKIKVPPTTGVLWLGGQRMDLINHIVNAPFNSRIITNTFRIGMEPVLASVVLKFSGRLFSSLPYDVLVPDCRPQANNSTPI